jgi:hypothetical protein
VGALSSRKVRRKSFAPTAASVELPRTAPKARRATPASRQKNPRMGAIRAALTSHPKVIKSGPAAPPEAFPVAEAETAERMHSDAPRE